MNKGIYMVTPKDESNRGPREVTIANALKLVLLYDFGDNVGLYGDGRGSLYIFNLTQEKPEVLPEDIGVSNTHALTVDGQEIKLWWDPYGARWYMRNNSKEKEFTENE